MSMIWHRWWLSALAIGLASPVPAAAQQTAAPRPITRRVTNLSADDARHRAIAERGGDPDTILPGDVLRYRLYFRNVFPAALPLLELRERVPQGFEYVPGSARSNPAELILAYSIDGGATYHAQPMLAVAHDAVRSFGPAPPRLYNVIRFKAPGAVPRGARITVEFRIRAVGPSSGSL
jgi:hypothetical protein